MKTLSVPIPGPTSFRSRELQLHQFGPKVERLFQPTGQYDWRNYFAVVTVACLGVGWIMWDTGPHFAEVGWMVGGVFIVLGLIPLCSTYSHTYLDLPNRRVVRIEYKHFRETSRHFHPFAEFRHVVVQPNSDPHWLDGEAVDGLSLGLKPAVGKNVLWLVTIEALSKGYPHEAYVFAKQLEKMTGLPLETVDDLLAETA